MSANTFHGTAKPGEAEEYAIRIWFGRDNWSHNTQLCFKIIKVGKWMDKGSVEEGEIVRFYMWEVKPVWIYELYKKET